MINEAMMKITLSPLESQIATRLAEMRDVDVQSLVNALLVQEAAYVFVTLPLSLRKSPESNDDSDAGEVKP